MAQFNVNSPLPNMYNDQLLGPLLNMIRKSKKYQTPENTLLNENLRP